MFCFLQSIWHRKLQAFLFEDVGRIWERSECEFEKRINNFFHNQQYKNQGSGQ